MSEDGEDEGLEVILTSLDSLRESIEGKFGRSNEEIDKRTIAERTSAHYGPRVGYRFFVERIDDLKDLIESKSKESLQQNVEHLNAFATQIDAWVDDEVRYLFDSSYTSNVTLSIVLILDGLERFIQRNMAPVDPKEYQRRVTKIRRSIDSLENSRAIEEERLKKLGEYVDRIIEAKDVADALPETMGTLKSALADVSEIRDRADASRQSIETAEKYGKETEEFLAPKRDQIASLVSRAEEALRASTGVGLAKAFSKNAKTLKWSSRFWVLGLLLALGLAVGIGYCRMTSIFEMIQKPGLDSSLVWVNIWMSFVLLAAPSWFAWIAAKRIAHLFRLIEDYEFKAAVSMSYEGYAREAAKYEETDFAERVLRSALTRFDEPPLRFVEPKDDGHPILEMVVRLFSAKWRLPVDDKKPDVKNESPKDDTEKP